MVRLDCGTTSLTVTGTETIGSNTILIDSREYYKKKREESKKQKRDRVSLELNKKSWVTFNERKPKIKQVIKPRTNIRH